VTVRAGDFSRSNQNEKEEGNMQELLRRKADIKSRLDSLSSDLKLLLPKVENLRERIAQLEDDYRDVLDAIRETEKGNRQ